LKTTNIGNEPVAKVSEYETVTMSIDDAGVEHLMSTMTNLYTNPPEAVLREYSANALDSHQRAETKKPVLISLPTRSMPLLIIRDFGVGLSKDELTNIYSKYGASTKRDSNKQIGAFGLGAKSALAIASRFDIVSTKDGITNTVYVEKNERGVGVFHFVSSEPAGHLENGVTITIPVKADLIEGFAKAAENFFVAWPKNSVLVDGLPPKDSVHGQDWFAIQSAGQPVGWVKATSVSNRPVGHIYHDGLPATYVVGGIRYRVRMQNANNFEAIRKELLAFVSSGNTAYINLPLGSVSLTPSRDELLFDQRTKEAIISASREFMTLAPTHLRSHLNTLDQDAAIKFYANNFSAIVLDESNGQNLANGPYANVDYKVKWRGETLPTFIGVASKSSAYLYSMKGRQLGVGEQTTSISIHDAATKRKSAGYYHVNSIVPHVLVKTSSAPVLPGKDKFSEEWELVRKNLRDYAEGKYDSDNVVLLMTTEDNKWISSSFDIATVDEIVEQAREQRKIRRSNSQLNTNRSKASYPVFKTSFNNKTPEKCGVNDLTGNVVYMEQTEGNYAMWTEIRDGFSSGYTSSNKLDSALCEQFDIFLPNTTIVFLARGKTPEALLKRYPEAKSIVAVVAEQIAGRTTSVEDASIFAGILSQWPLNNRGSLADYLTKHNLLNKIKSEYTRDVLGAVAREDDMYVLCSLIKSLPGVAATTEYERIEAIMSKHIVYNFEKKFEHITVNGYHAERPEYRNNVLVSINAVDDYYRADAASKGIIVD